MSGTISAMIRYLEYQEGLVQYGVEDTCLAGHPPQYSWGFPLPPSPKRLIAAVDKPDSIRADIYKYLLSRFQHFTFQGVQFIQTRRREEECGFSFGSYNATCYIARLPLE
ncbi:hypothetical protein C7212DRAFT_344168 [Tuber magnatum]|uniref:Uncharacterized protein n=1 Tax=Tuber magnatum TaxID=42249 RepID=A0A317SQ48_9PEZI|nr:hypothetical protein C7212DRAFT_344167 [Tuber magnatum]PWW76575.1 hypothetical protein C7212DRAFT_344168 [Tuber magnatum]